MLNRMQVIAEEGGRKNASYLSNFACPAWKSWSSPTMCWYLHLTLSQLQIFIFYFAYLPENIAVSFTMATIPPLPSSRSRLAQDYVIHLLGT